MFIKKVSIKNFRSFKDVEFEFQKTGLFLLNGKNEELDCSNGSGKSSIFESVFFGLYGRTTKNIKIAEVVRRGTKTCEVMVEMENNNNTYIITRKRPSGLVLIENGISVNINEKELQNYIENNVLKLSYDLFLQICYFPQNSSSTRFIFSNDSEMKNSFSNLLNWNKISTALIRVKENITKINKENDELNIKKQSLINSLTFLTSVEPEHIINNNYQIEIIKLKSEIIESQNISDIYQQTLNIFYKNQEIIKNNELIRKEIEINNNSIKEIYIYKENNEQSLEIEKLIQNIEINKKIIENIQNNKQIKNKIDLLLSQNSIYKTLVKELQINEEEIINEELLLNEIKIIENKIKELLNTKTYNEVILNQILENVKEMKETNEHHLECPVCKSQLQNSNNCLVKFNKNEHTISINKKIEELREQYRSISLIIENTKKETICQNIELEYASSVYKNSLSKNMRIKQKEEFNKNIIKENTQNEKNIIQNINLINQLEKEIIIYENANSIEDDYYKMVNKLNVLKTTQILDCEYFEKEKNNIIINNKRIKDKNNELIIKIKELEKYNNKIENIDDYKKEQEITINKIRELSIGLNKIELEDNLQNIKLQQYEKDLNKFKQEEEIKKNINKELLNIEQRFSETSNELSDLSFLKVVFSPQGIIGNSLENIIKELNFIGNQFLADLSGDTLQYMFSSINDKEQFKITHQIFYKDTICSLESLSGGEQRTVILSVDFAFSELILNKLNLPAPNLIFLDECFEGLDSVIKEKVMNTLVKISQNRSVYSVDHASEFLSLFNNIITIIKKDNISTISDM